MSISAINSITFKGNTQQVETKQPVQQERKTGGVAPAIGSFFLPGLGNFMNGDNKAGFKFLGGQIGLGVLAALSIHGTVAALIKENKALYVVSTIGTVLSCFGSLALKIADIAKAYKGKEPELIEQTENKVDTKA